MKCSPINIQAAAFGWRTIKRPLPIPRARIDWIPGQVQRVSEHENYETGPVSQSFMIYLYVPRIFIIKIWNTQIICKWHTSSLKGRASNSNQHPADAMECQTFAHRETKRYTRFLCICRTWFTCFVARCPLVFRDYLSGRRRIGVVVFELELETHCIIYNIQLMSTFWLSLCFKPEGQIRITDHPAPLRMRMPLTSSSDLMDLALLLLMLEPRLSNPKAP